MLPEMPKAHADNPDGSLLADRFGVRRAPGME